MAARRGPHALHGRRRRSRLGSSHDPRGQRRPRRHCLPQRHGGPRARLLACVGFPASQIRHRQSRHVRWHHGQHPAPRPARQLQPRAADHQPAQGRRPEHLPARVSPLLLRERHRPGRADRGQPAAGRQHHGGRAADPCRRGHAADLARPEGRRGRAADRVVQPAVRAAARAPRAHRRVVRSLPARRQGAQHRAGAVLPALPLVAGAGIRQPEGLPGRPSRGWHAHARGAPGV